MAYLCKITKKNIGILILSFIMKLLLGLVTTFGIYSLIKVRKFRDRASNIIIVNILIADTLNAITSGVYGLYLRMCELIKYKECTSIIVMTRTFTYISMAFMMFFSIERYCKVMCTAVEYNILFSKNRIKYSIIATWILFSVFSVITTPFWIYLILPETEFIKKPYCTYSTIMEPLVGIITIIISNIIPTIFLIVINIGLASKIRDIFMKSEKKLNFTDAQKDKNKEIVKKVELNIYIMSFILTLINLLNVSVSIYDITIFVSYLKDDISAEDEKIAKMLTNIISIHPMLEAVTCFILNKDMVDLFESIIYPKFKIKRKKITG